MNNIHKTVTNSKSLNLTGFKELTPQQRDDILEQWLSYYKHLLALDNWRIALTTEVSPSKMQYNLGLVSYQEANRTAYIDLIAYDLIEPTPFDGFDDLEVTLVHELLEIKFSEFCDEGDGEDSLRRRREHSALNDIARAIVLSRRDAFYSGQEDSKPESKFHRSEDRPKSMTYEWKPSAPDEIDPRTLGQNPEPVQEPEIEEVTNNETENTEQE